MPTLTVALAKRSYPIIIESGLLNLRADESHGKGYTNGQVK